MISMHLLFIVCLFPFISRIPPVFSLHTFHHPKSLDLVCFHSAWCTHWHNKKTHMIYAPLPYTPWVSPFVEQYPSISSCSYLRRTSNGKKRPQLIQPHLLGELEDEPTSPWNSSATPSQTYKQSQLFLDATVEWYPCVSLLMWSNVQMQII